VKEISTDAVAVAPATGRPASRPRRARAGKTAVVEGFSLSNGVRVLLKPRPDLPLVSMLTVFPGGGRFEPAGKSGLGHLMHRMMTKGSARFSAEEIAAKIEGLGGGIESYSSFDTGGVSVGVLSEFAEEAVDVYRDVLRAPRFEAARVTQEKARLLEELKRRHDNPVPFAMDHLFRCLFGDHPYAHPFLGDPSEIESLTPEDCAGWYRGLLAPERTVVSIVGDLSADRARAIAERLLGDLVAHPAPTPRAAAPAAPVKPGEHVLRRAGIKQSVVFVGFPAPAMMTDASWALEALNGVLTGLGGRLFVELRDKRSLGYMTGSAYNALCERGVFFGYANPGAEGVDEAVRVILHELEKVTKEPVTDEELARAKEWLIGSHLMELQRNGAQAAAYGTYEAMGYGWEAVDRVPELIRAVSKDDIVAAARATFERDHAVIVRLLPD
jgi:zinc protease